MDYRHTIEHLMRQNFELSNAIMWNQQCITNMLTGLHQPEAARMQQRFLDSVQHGIAVLSDEMKRIKLAHAKELELVEEVHRTEIDKLKAEIAEKDAIIAVKDAKIAKKDTELTAKDAIIAEKDAVIADMDIIKVGELKSQPVKNFEDMIFSPLPEMKSAKLTAKEIRAKEKAEFEAKEKEFEEARLKEARNVFIAHAEAKKQSLKELRSVVKASGAAYNELVKAKQEYARDCVKLVEEFDTTKDKKKSTKVFDLRSFV